LETQRTATRGNDARRRRFRFITKRVASTEEQACACFRVVSIRVTASSSLGACAKFRAKCRQARRSSNDSTSVSRACVVSLERTATFVGERSRTNETSFVNGRDGMLRLRHSVRVSFARVRHRRSDLIGTRRAPKFETTDHVLARSITEVFVVGASNDRKEKKRQTLLARSIDQSEY
jgi:hypothetical protein